jgi:hypothetical protein
MTYPREQLQRACGVRSAVCWSHRDASKALVGIPLRAADITVGIGGLSQGACATRDASAPPPGRGRVLEHCPAADVRRRE